jgi:hypothetical protein
VKSFEEKTKSPPRTLSYRSLLSPKSCRLSCSGSDTSEKLFSPRSPSPVKKSPPDSVEKREFHLSFTTDETTSQRSPSLLSDKENEGVLNPVLTSTRRSPVKDNVKEINGEETPLKRNVNYSRGGGRMSPNALERRLRAELNLFDSVGDSLQQITEVGGIRDIVQAQQETVSLAQVLKNRQLQHQKEIDRMSIEAREKASQSSRDVQLAQRNALEAETNAQRAIAEVKSKAADKVAQSTQIFSENQNKATSISLDAIRESEQVRRDAFETYKRSIDNRLSNVGEMMTAAASAASTAAVEVALKHHRDKLESLRKDSVNKISKSYTNSFTTSDSSSSTSSRTETGGNRTLTQVDGNLSTAKRSQSHLSSEDIKEEISGKISHTHTLSSIKSPTQTQTSSIKSSIKSASYIEPSSNENTLTNRKTPNTAPTKSDGISEHLPTDNDKTDEITEDIPTSQKEDRELTEALFSGAIRDEKGINEVIFA